MPIYFRNSVLLLKSSKKGGIGPFWPKFGSQLKKLKEKEEEHTAKTNRISRDNVNIRLICCLSIALH